ncbi:hypothetical protein BK123_23450 [Paenibacillus lautus]|uniref:Uncharacterized protein n=1 Tax=Paenibacillus lautus TaxID=1401 RepID=A0A1R1AX48_PAELA|nr:hypothetical protein BK123_23450 [Paenibacillus lautus]
MIKDPDTFNKVVFEHKGTALWILRLCFFILPVYKWKNVDYYGFKSIYKIRINKLYRMNYKLDRGDI